MNQDIQQQYAQLEQQIEQLRASSLSSRERLEQGMALHRQRLALLPQVSFQRGTPFAQVLENPYPWDIGAPLPHVIGDGNNTYLAYILSRHAQIQDHDIPVLKKNDGSYNCALLHFTMALDFKFGGPNDEVFDAHPLEGLECYALHQVHNSPWLAQLQKINAAYFSYQPDWWRDVKHYFFSFHDQCFECIAKGYTVELYHGYIHDVMQIAFDRVFP